jgi:hypothetical protein
MSGEVADHAEWPSSLRCTRGVVLLALEVLEEGPDERRVEVGDVELARRVAGATRGERTPS